MSSRLLFLGGGGTACVPYHLICSMWYAWLDRDVDIEYDAVQVNHNHEYRSSVQANYVGYPRVYHGMRSIRFFDVFYAIVLSSAWSALSCLPSVDVAGSCLVCFLCVLLPTAVHVRFVFVAFFLLNVRIYFEVAAGASSVSLLSLLRSFCFVMCFVMDRFVCLPAQVHFMCALMVAVFSRDSLAQVTLLPAVAPLVFCRDVLHARPSHLLMSTVLFLTITAINHPY